MTKTNLTTIIDQFGALKAQMAELDRQEKALKEALAELEPGAYEGDLFRLTISASERTGQDKAFKARVEELIEEHLSAQYITAHTTRTEVRTHKVTARNGHDC